jgi:hypothetical protein
VPGPTAWRPVAWILTTCRYGEFSTRSTVAEDYVVTALPHHAGWDKR